MSNLEERVLKLEAAEDVRNLKAVYARICDEGYDADALAELFTDDAIWDGGEHFGIHYGREAIKEFFGGIPERIQWALHLNICPQIDVEDGSESATGTWYLFEPCTLDGRAVWLSGVYNEKYRKVDGAWKFTSIQVVPQTITPFEEGWVKQRFLS